MFKTLMTAAGRSRAAEKRRQLESPSARTFREFDSLHGRILYDISCELDSLSRRSNTP